MGPFSALDSVFTKYFSFKGRASRSEYWWYQLMYFIILIAAFSFDVYLFDPNAPVSLNPLSYFTSFWLLANIVPNLTVSVRRLHDSGKSGLFWLVLFIPFIGSILFIILMVLESDHRDNIYGPPPFGTRGSGYAGNDLDDVSLTGRGTAQAKGNPYAAYAYLDQARQQPSAEMIAARKEEVRSLYQTRVLGKAPPPVPDAG